MALAELLVVEAVPVVDVFSLLVWQPLNTAAAAMIKTELSVCFASWFIVCIVSFRS